MSSDFAVKARRALGMVAIVALGFALSACQVRPLYSETNGVAGKLSSVSFSDPSSRVGQEVRNRLVFFTGRGAGEPAKAEYNVDLRVSSVAAGVLYVQSSDTSLAGRVTVTADYTLKRASDGQVIKAGNRSAISLVDFPVQEFAKLRAIRDGENRAAREVADLVGADIAAALGR